MPVTKEFRSINNQIIILKNRNLKFRNVQRAEEILQKYNYFDVINGFETILLDKTPSGTASVKHYTDVYFEDFKELFFFDMELKKFTLFKILDIEARLRTSIAYHFASVYCSTLADTMNYIDPHYYAAPLPTSTHMHNVFTSFDLFRQTQYYPNGAVKRKSFIDEQKEKKDYIAQYTDPPFWVTIKALPLGTLYYLFIFLDDVVKEKVLNDFGFMLSDANAFTQALYVLKEVRNQCAHLELITRFKLKRTASVNNLNDITLRAHLSHGPLNYMDVMKIFKLFDGVSDLKNIIIRFYIRMTLKLRKKIAIKALSKMGRKSIKEWWKL